MITIPIYTFVTIILITFGIIGVMIYFAQKYQEMELKLFNRTTDLDEAINHFNYWKTKYKKVEQRKTVTDALMENMKGVK